MKCLIQFDGNMEVVEWATVTSSLGWPREFEVAPGNKVTLNFALFDDLQVDAVKGLVFQSQPNLLSNSSCRFSLSGCKQHAG